MHGAIPTTTEVDCEPRVAVLAGVFTRSPGPVSATRSGRLSCGDRRSMRVSPLLKVRVRVSPEMEIPVQS